MSSQVPSNSVYAVATGTAKFNQPVVSSGPPSSANVIGSTGPFNLGQVWVDTLNNNIYGLAGITTSNGITSAMWTLLSGGASSLTFDADSGSAMPSANIININGAGSVSTSAAGNTITITGAGGAVNITPNTGVNITNSTFSLTGIQVAASGVPVQTDGTSASSLVVDVQLASPQASSSAANAGLASFNSTQFTVDANGWVGIMPGSGEVNITPNAGVNVTNSSFSLMANSVAAAGIPARTFGNSATSMTIQIQDASAQASSSGANAGLASFNSANFSVDANGYVSSIAGPGAIDITPNIGVAITNSTFTMGGLAVAASGHPIQTNGTSSSAELIQVQVSSAQATSSLTNAGLASFSSAQFAVDANGFVTNLNGLPSSNFPVQAATAPGTNPVLPSASGAVTINGAAVAAAGIPVRSDSLAANTLQIEVQRASQQAASSAANAGLASFNSAQFTVDANGYVSDLNGLPSSSFGVQAFTGPGTSPVLPTAAGLVTVNGTIVAAHAVPLRTDSLAANTINVEAQYASAQASSSGANAGMASFNSTQFTVDANGFVSSVGMTETWIDQATSTTAAVSTGYFATAAITLTLPLGTSQGAIIEVFNDFGASVVIGAGAGEQIRIGNVISSAGGSATSSLQGDSIRLVFRAATKTWNAVPGTEGNWGLA